MTNEELLVYGNSALLTHIEKQEQFLLREAYRRKPCPNCGQPVNQFEGLGVAVNDYNTHASHADDAYKCPGCQRRLRFVLPFPTGAWQWALKKEDTCQG